MYIRTILAVAFASITAAAAAPTKKYYGIGLEFRVSPPGEPAVLEPSPIEINKLTSVHHVQASEIFFDKRTAVNVAIDSIECRAYKDAAGVVPGSASFRYNKPAYLSTNLVEVGSVLCYIVETS